MEPIETIVEIVTPLVALYGAVLATFLGVKELRSDRLSAFVSHGWGYSGDSIMRQGPPDELSLYAVNDGHRDLVVSSLALEIEGFCQITPGFLEPYGASSTGNSDVEDRRLGVGDRIEVRFDNAALNRFIEDRELQKPVRARAVLEDTREHFFCSSWFEIGG